MNTNARARDYPAQYLAQIYRPGDPLTAVTAGGAAYLSGTTNAGYADAVLSAWQSPTLTEDAAINGASDVPIIGPALDRAGEWFKGKGITAGGVVLGLLLAVLALYLLAKGD